MERGRTPTQLQVTPSKSCRTELLAWLNDLMSRITVVNLNAIPQVHKVEQCGNGVPYVLILTLLLPTPYPPLLTKAKIPARHDFESVANFKLVADALQKNNISRPDVLTDEIDKLINGAYQANLQLLQWFHGLYNTLLQRVDRPDVFDNIQKEASDANKADAQSFSDGNMPQNKCMVPDVVDVAAEHANCFSEATVFDRTSEMFASIELTTSKQKDGLSRIAHSTEKVGCSLETDGRVSKASERPHTAEQGGQRKTPRSALLGRRGCSPPASATAALEKKTKAATTVSRSLSASRTVQRATSLKVAQSRLSVVRSGDRNGNVASGEQRAALAGGVLSRRCVNTADNPQSVANSTITSISSSRGAMKRGSAVTNGSNNGNKSFRASGTRPLVNCGASENNSRLFSSRSKGQLVSGHRGGLASSFRSVRSSAPTGLFQTKITRLSNDSSVGSQGVVVAGNNEALLEQSVIKAMTDERQFFYDKLRQIEILVAPLTDKKGVDGETMKLAQSVLSILYSTK